MPESSDLDPGTPRPLRRRRMWGVLTMLVCAAAIGLASSAAVLAWDLQDAALIWLSLLADAIVVMLAAELAIRGSRRREAEDELAELSQRHGHLEKSVSPHYASVTVDHEGSILTWSEGAEQLTGYSADESIGNTFAFLLPPVTADIGLQAQLLRTALQARKAATECWLVNASGERVWVHLSLAALIGEEKWIRRFHLVLRDLSEGENARQALREHETSLQRILDSAADAIITVDEQQRIVLFNPAAERVFRCARQQAIGQPFDRFIPECYGLAHRAEVEGLGVTDIARQRWRDEVTLTALRADGSEFPIDASISQTQLQGRKLYTAILRDITARVKVQEALHRSHEEVRQFALALQSSREQEKTRLARELRAHVGQGMAALKVDLAWLAQNVKSRDPAVRDKLRATAVALDRIAAETQRISADLQPLILDDLGFAAATELLISDFKKQTGTACDYHVDAGVQDIGEPIASALFRALQESLTNVARHAHTSHVDVQVLRENGAVQLEVSDDGEGVDDAGEGQLASSELHGLTQRALMLGGEAKTVRLDSGGTRVVFRVPLHGRSDQHAHP